MQLKRPSRPARPAAFAAPAVAALAIGMLAAWPARAQVAELDTSHTVFYEAPTRTHMFVYSPSGDVRVSPFSWLDVRGGWEADVVSGASVATKAGAAYEATHGADVITTASVHDCPADRLAPLQPLTENP